MKSINFSTNIINLRKSKSITQKDLADYLGISKSAVSKWEKNLSYPDISLLPLIASYFDISIDDLLGYEPLMDDEEVRKLYKKLIQKFATDNFDDVYNECLDYEKKYYRCYFLQFHLGLLYLNHANLSQNPERAKEIYLHAREVFERVELESNDLNLSKQALGIKSYCNITIGEFDKVIEDLKDINQLCMPSEIILSKAYELKGNKKESIKILQIFIFNNIINTIQAMSDIIVCYDNDKEKSELYFDKLITILKVFDLKNEYPQGYLNISIFIALIYAKKGDIDNAFYYLQQCVDIIANKEMLSNKNNIFESLTEFIEEQKIGNIMPRNIKVIVDDLKRILQTHPDFERIRADIRYNNLLGKLNMED